MRVYRWIWSTILSLAITLGCVLAMARSWVDCLILAVIAGLCVGVLSANLRTEDGSPPTRAFWRRVSSDAGAAIVLLVAVYGLGTSMGADVVLLVAAMVITCPPLVSKVHHWLNGTEPDPVEPYAEAGPRLDDRPAPGDHSELDALEQLSTDTLCHEWCRTSLQLLRTTEPQTTSRIAAGRARLLDELERRNPVGFASWLDSGARPFSDPRRFLNENDARRR